MSILPNFRSLSLASLGLIPALLAEDDRRVQPFAGNPSFWQYHGKPVLLLGGSDDDNLFQWDEDKLTEQLDLHVAAGGNHLRNTMSSRDEGNVFPFAKGADGKYDLDEWNPEYWKRFERFLRMTAEREIIVQIEFWDPWDTYLQAWQENPWNPENNVTYSAENSRLAAEYSSPRYRDGTSYGKPHDTKIYGADTGPVWAGKDRDALWRFWRNIIGGAATSRFHRPPAGMGLNGEARRHLRSARMLAEAFDFFRAAPDAGHELLSDRAKNAAYLSAVAGKQYAVYFPDGGSVGLDLGDAPESFTLKWLEIGECRWSEATEVAGGGTLILAPPGEGHWVAHLQASE